MQPTDFQRFKAVMNGMAKLYEREIDEALLDAYWLALSRWSLDEFQSAAGHLMQTSKFMPRPADFHALRRKGAVTAGEAWAAVLDVARRGYVRWQGGGMSRDSSVPDLDDPVIARAVRAIGGYEAIAMSPKDKTCFLEQRFCEHFEALQDAEEVREAVPELVDSRRAIGGPLGIKELMQLTGQGKPS